MIRTMISLLSGALLALVLTTTAHAADTDGDGVGNALDIDFDNDGVPGDVDDFEILQAAFLSVSSDADFDAALDLDGDGIISGLDITIFLQLSSS